MLPVIRIQITLNRCVARKWYFIFSSSAAKCFPKIAIFNFRFSGVFANCLRSAKSASLITLEKWVIYVLKAFISDKTNSDLAQLLLEYTTPKPRMVGGTIDGIQFAESLLGSLLSLSILPKTHNGPYEYFDSVADAQSSSLSSSLWNYLTLHLDDMHTIIKGILLIGGETRNKMLEWIGLCLHTNGKIDFSLYLCTPSNNKTITLKIIRSQVHVVKYGMLIIRLEC